MSSAVALATGGYISNSPSATPMATGGYIDFHVLGFVLVSGLIVGVLTEEIDLESVLRALEDPEATMSDFIDLKSTIKEKL